MKINIYGTKDSAMLFFLHHPEIEVNRFIDGNLSEEETFDFNFADRNESYKILPLLKAEKDLKKYYTVVATSIDAYWKIKKSLELIGLKEFVNFEYHSTFKKKIAVTYGNCNAHGIRKLLSANDSFNAIYGFYPLQYIHEIDKNTCPINYQLSDVILDKCDLFLFQDIRTNNRFGPEYASELFVKRINKRCHKICVPNFVHLPTFLFPQVIFPVETSYHYKNRSSFRCRDFYLDKFHSTRSVDSLQKMICEDDMIDHQFINDLLDEFSAKIKKRESCWDIKVSDFIFSRYKKIQLFYDPLHPTKALLSYIANKILNLLQLKENNSCGDFRPVGGVYLDDSNVPIYHSVEKCLGLNYSNDLLGRSFLRDNCSYSLCCTRTVKEYVRDYILWHYGPREIIL